MKRYATRILCRVIGHRPVRKITALKIQGPEISGGPEIPAASKILGAAILGAVTFEATTHTHTCQRCGAQPLPCSCTWIGRFHI